MLEDKEWIGRPGVAQASAAGLGVSGYDGHSLSSQESGSSLSDSGSEVELTFVSPPVIQNCFRRALDPPITHA